jgi:hypothetical protein
LYFEFAAFVLSFDGPDDDDGDGEPDLWGIAEWAAFEISPWEGPPPRLGPRPRWRTDPELFLGGIAPGDASYAARGAGRLPEVKGDYRFVRGHLCPRETAGRLGAEAAWETFTLLNAVPQLQWQNNGVWRRLEELCLAWADRFGKVWVICGPVFFNRSPSLWLGQGLEKRTAVPDALFKIVLREEPSGQTLAAAFLIPNVLPRERRDLGEFLTTPARIEEAAGLRFFLSGDECRINAGEDWPGL